MTGIIPGWLFDPFDRWLLTPLDNWARRQLSPRERET